MVREPHRVRPAAFHVADPAFVNDTATSVVAPVFIVAGNVFAPHVTAYVGVATVTVADCTVPCHENHVTSSFTMSYQAYARRHRRVASPPGATSLGSTSAAPEPPAGSAVCQWYANRTGFVPPAFHVADPAS